jgi:uncharacterized YkwD family protein
MQKRNLIIYLFFVISLLLPLVLYYSVDLSTVPEYAEDLNKKNQVGDAAPGDEINYYDLIYSQKKDPAVGLEGKARFIAESQPEPEPEPTPQPGIDSGQQKAPVSSSSSNSQKEQQMINYINEARRNAGLPALQVSSQLTNAARAKSKDMADNSYFGHYSPTYGNFPGILSRFGVSYRSAGENIAMNSNGSVYDAHIMLMNSSGHRANILSSGYKNVGIGIYVKSDGGHYYTQLFVGF